MVRGLSRPDLYLLLGKLSDNGDGVNFGGTGGGRVGETENVGRILCNRRRANIDAVNGFEGRQGEEDRYQL